MAKTGLYRTQLLTVLIPFQFDQPEPTDEPSCSYRTRQLPDRQLPSPMPQTMMQHNRAPSENVCGSLASYISAASMRAPPEIVYRRQHAATGFQGDVPGQWDWRSAISPLPTSTMDNVAIATDTQREFVAGSQNVIVLDEDTPGGPQREGIDKKTQHRHKHRKHKDRNKHDKHNIKAKPPTEKETNEYSTISQHVEPVVITEQTTRDQSLSDRSMSSPQPLSESWMCEQRTEGDPRTQQETAIYAIPRSGEDRSMSSSQPLTESWMCEQRTEGDPRTQQETAIYANPRSGDDHAKIHKHGKHHGGHRQERDVAEGRSGYVSNVTDDGGMDRRHFVENTETTGRVVDESVQHVVFGDDHSKKHKYSKHHGGHKHKRDVAEGRSGYASNVTEDGGMDRRHFVEHTETTGRVVDESVQQVVFGDGHSKKHKHSKLHGRQHRRDIAEGRSDHPINAAKDRGMERKHKDTKTNARVIDGHVEHFTFAPALSTPRSCPSYLRRLELDKRARSGSSSYVPTIHAVPLPPSRLDHQYDATSNNVASVSRQMVARANWGTAYETIPQGEQQRKSFCVYPA